MKRNEKQITPIFIGGCERSGTTLLGSLLGRIPGAVCTPESQFKFDICDRSVGEAVSIIENSFRFKLWELDRDDLNLCKKECSSGRGLMLCLVRRYSEKKLGSKKVRWWIDHTPYNLRKSSCLKSCFPNAKYIHILRDGRGVTASVLPLDWGPNTALFAGPWWVTQVGYALAAEGMLGERIIRVSYEELLESPVDTISSIIRHCRMETSVNMIGRDAEGFKVPKYSQGQHRLIGAEIDKSRAMAWQNELTMRQIRDFEGEAADMLTLLGYNCVTHIDIEGRHAYKSGLFYKAARFFQDRCKDYLINRIRYTVRRMWTSKGRYSFHSN